jgi:hypothetical protein
MSEFDSKVFSDYLDRNCFELRDKWREFTKDDIFKPVFNLGLNE